METSLTLLTILPINLQEVESVTQEEMCCDGAESRVSMRISRLMSRL